MSGHFRILRSRWGLRRISAFLAAAGLLASAIASSASAVGPAGIVADSHGRPLYVTNSGRDFGGATGPHNVSIYNIGPAGELMPLGQPVPTGMGARGIVFGPDGHNAYVVALEENAVYSYNVGDKGELVPLGSPTDTGGQAPIGIAIAPSGRSLYTTNLNSGTVSIFAVGPDGKPALLGEPVNSGAPNPRNTAVSPDGRLLFVSHGVPGDQVPDVLVTFSIHPDGTLRRAKPPVTIGSAGAGIGISPNGQFLYVACLESDDVHGFRIGADGDLSPVPGSPFPAPKTAEGVAVTPDGRHLYVASVATRPVHSPDDDGVWTFAIGADGALTAVGPRTEAGTGPVGVTSTPDRRHLYVSNFFSDNVSAFEIAPSSGTLREVAGSPFPSRGKAPAFDALGVLPNQGPVASFSVQTQPAGQATRFDGTSSSDHDGRVVRYDWDFGDGTVLSNGGLRPTHVYQRPGGFQVTLVVTDNEGCSTGLVFTGHSALCNGSPAARSILPVAIPR